MTATAPGTMTAAAATTPASRIYQLKGDPYSSHAAILRLAGDGAGRRALDVGAADGFVSERLAQQGWRVTGIEGDPSLADAGRQRGQDIMAWDLNQGAPVLDGAFDLIVYGDVLEHLLAPEALFRALNRLLTPQGRVIVSVPNVAHLWVRLRLLRGNFDYMDRGIMDRTHRRFFTKKTFLEFLKAGDMELADMVPIPVPLRLAVPSRWHGRWLNAAQWISAIGAKGWPGGLAYQFVAISWRRIS